MIETIMLVALGFTAASLLALLIAPALWRRARKLMQREIEATMPVTVSDINADKDLLRAEYTVELRRLEMDLERARDRAARHLMERNQHMVEKAKLESEIADLKGRVEERKHASSVLEQTVQKRIPEIEDDLARARMVISAREQELAERARAFENQGESLELAQKMIRGQEQEIERLRNSLEGGEGMGLPVWKRGSEPDEKEKHLIKQNGELQAELSRLREEMRKLQEMEISDANALRDEMHRLADLMLKGTPVRKEKPKAAKDGPATTTASKSAKKPAAAAKAPASETSGSKKSPAKPGRRLTDRLSLLKKKKEKEDA